MIFLRNFDKLYQYFLLKSERQQFYMHEEKTPISLTKAIEEMRDNHPEFIRRDVLKKPLLILVAEECYKREQRRWRGCQQPEEGEEEMTEYEKEADKLDDLMKHELRIRRAMLFATERAKRIK